MFKHIYSNQQNSFKFGINTLLVYSSILYLTACIAFKTVPEGTIPSQTDYTKFHKRKINNQTPAFHFISSVNNQLGKKLFIENKSLDPSSIPLDSLIYKHKSIAFVIIRNDSIIYEKYAAGYSDTSIVSSFSIAKAFVAALVGIAIDEKLIKSEYDCITDYLPELKTISGFDKITIEYLLHHTSGIKFSDEEFRLSSDNARFYWGTNIREEIVNLKIECPPGTKFHYSSVNPELLALILEKVYQTSLSQILQEKIWKPLGMESSAEWAIDRKDQQGVEKAFCCLYARAIDFAKFGRLYLNHGNWNGKQIVPEEWVKKSINPHPVGNNRMYYHNNLGLSPMKYHSFYAVGLFGQYIYCNPEKNIIIIRFGNTKLNYNPAYWNLMMMQLMDQL